MLSTPPNSSPIRRKRSFQDEDYEYYDIHDNIKRLQDTKIFTETHQNTVQMMIDAQKNLQKLEKAGLLQIKEDYEQSSQPQDTFKQAPYWPVINRVKN